MCDLSPHGLSKRRALLSAPLSSFVQAMSGDPKGAGEVSLLVLELQT